MLPLSGSVIDVSPTVNQEIVTNPNRNFDSLDLSDFFDMVKILTEDIISKKRIRINKKRTSGD